MDRQEGEKSVAEWGRDREIDERRIERNNRDEGGAYAHGER